MEIWPLDSTTSEAAAICMDGDWGATSEPAIVIEPDTEILMEEKVDKITVTPELMAIEDEIIALTAVLMVTLEVTMQPLTKFPEPQILLSNNCNAAVAAATSMQIKIAVAISVNSERYTGTGRDGACLESTW